MFGRFVLSYIFHFLLKENQDSLSSSSEILESSFVFCNLFLDFVLLVISWLLNIWINFLLDFIPFIVNFSPSFLNLMFYKLIIKL